MARLSLLFPIFLAIRPDDSNTRNIIDAQKIEAVGPALT